ncbi:GNAT family N-acetyltransferase [Flavobacterium sp.]|uniref:GNAT family N-acetyltransferase n=1 Tax=Flavobacterium sp. TaxID=239 RepID=UPI00374D7137
MKTENYIVDKLQPIDSNQLYQFMSDNKERLKLFFPVTLEMNSSLEKTEAYISIKNKEIEEKTNFTFAIRDKKNHQIGGLIIIKKIDWDKNQGEFAYCIGSELEGKGVTSFAVKEMINFAFEELGLKTIQIISHKTNFGSVKVAENNGFVWQKTLQNEFTPTNETPLDMELYELYIEK